MLYNKIIQLKNLKISLRENKKLTFVKISDLKKTRIKFGAGLILSKVKKYSKTTTGIDSIHYKKYLESKGHIHLQT